MPTHTLETIETSHILLCISKHIRPIIAHAKYFVTNPFIDEVSTTRLVERILQDVVEFILSNMMLDYKISTMCKRGIHLSKNTWHPPERFVVILVLKGGLDALLQLSNEKCLHTMGCE
jgi:hypothetical protein